LLLWFCVGWAQQDSRSGAVRPHTVSLPAHAVQIAGRVSRDGKLLVSEDQEQWTISNPGALRGQEGHWVTVKCQLSSDQNRIHVFSVAGSETSLVARPADAAFRR
jgi:hypothetical protein